MLYFFCSLNDVSDRRIEICTNIYMSFSKQEFFSHQSIYIRKSMKSSFLICDPTSLVFKLAFILPF